MKDTLHTIHKDTDMMRERKMRMWEEWDLHVFNFIQRQTGDKINDDTYRADQVSLRNSKSDTPAFCQ